MKKALIFTTVLIFVSLGNIFAQKYYREGTQAGYYIKNGEKVNVPYIVNASRLERTRVLEIYEQEKHPAARLFPEDISEYGLEDGSRYFSAQIKLNQKTESVFLEHFLQIDDSTALFCYPGKKGEVYFVQEGINNTQLYAMIKDEKEIKRLLKKDRETLCDKLGVIDSIPLKISRSSILTFYKAYTDCNINAFRTIHIGITLGIGMGKPASSTIPKFSYKLRNEYSAGIFADIPLDEKFSFHPEILYVYTQNNSGTAEGWQNTTTGISKYQKKSLWIPLSFRCYFTQFRGKYIPFIEVGPFIDICLDRQVRKVNIKNDRGYDNHSLSQYGGLLGGGIEYKISRKNSLYLGLRYQVATGSYDDYKETSHHLGVNIALGF